MSELFAALGSYGPAFARAAAFAATAPLAGSGAIPRAVRATLALVLTPLVANHIGPGDVHAVDFTLSASIENAIVGAAFGIGAAAVASAAAAAGGFADAALGSQLIDRPERFGGSGSFAQLYSLGFAFAFLASGSMTHLCDRFVNASSSIDSIAWNSFALIVAHRVVGAALTLAAPAIAAQIMATVIAAFIARAAPRINGMMLASPLVGVLLLAALVAAAPVELEGFAALAHAAASAPYP